MSTTRHWPLQLLLGWVNLAMVAPVIFLYIGLPLILRQQGWSGTQIGLLQLAGLPALLKFVLASPVQRHCLGKASYRNWSLLLGTAYIAALLALAASPVDAVPHWQLFALAVAVNLFATWMDVPVNALAIQLLPESERLRAGAIRAAVTSLGAIIGGGVMLMLSTRFGWGWSFIALAALLLSAQLMLLLPRRSAAAASPSGYPAAVGNAGWQAWRSWFIVPGHRSWAWIVLVYVPFIGAVWVYLKPLLLDQGFAAERIAAIVGIGGGAVSALASIAGSWLSRRRGAHVALPVFAMLSLLAVALLALAVATQASAAVFVGASLLVAVALGAASGLVFGLMLLHTRPGLAALDYGIQSSLFVLTRTFVPLLAGVLLDHFGQLGMLTGLTIALCAVCVLALRLRHRLGHPPAPISPPL